jgi:hypothetical protein
MAGMSGPMIVAAGVVAAGCCGPDACVLPAVDRAGGELVRVGVALTAAAPVDRPAADLCGVEVRGATCL